MISLSDQETGDVQHLAAEARSFSSSAIFSDPVFLMVNSLETGGTERQFVEMARAFRANGTPLHPGCLLNQAPFSTDLTLIPAARMAGIPVVGSQRQIGDLLTPAQFWAQLATFWLCDRVVCNSHAAAERLLQAGLPKGKVVVIGNALPPEAFAETSPALPCAEGTLRIGMI